jgi:hypothetical protein
METPQENETGVAGAFLNRRPRFGNNAPEIIRNPKHEVRNKHETQNPNDRNDGVQSALVVQAIGELPVLVIWIWDILICFGFRISNFDFGP